LIRPTAVLISQQADLCIEHLPCESGAVGEYSCAGRVGIGGVRAEGIGVPRSHRGIVARASDLPRRIELVAVDVVDGDRGAVRAQGRDGDIAQPDGFFDQGAGAVVFAEEVAGFVIGVEDRAVDATADSESGPTVL